MTTATSSPQSEHDPAEQVGPGDTPPPPPPGGPPPPPSEPPGGPPGPPPPPPPPLAERGGLWEWATTSVRQFWLRWWDWWQDRASPELRAGWIDTRRAPAIPIAGAVVVFWPLSDWSLTPLIAGALVLAAGMLVSRVILRSARFVFRIHALTRWRMFYMLAASVTSFAMLVAAAGPLQWGLAFGLWLIGIGATDDWRARKRLLYWLKAGLAEAVSVDTADFSTRRAQWSGRDLVEVTIAFSRNVQFDQEARRQRMVAAVEWRMRHAGPYSVEWPAGRSEMLIRRITLDLPNRVDDQIWPDDTPGVPLGVTTSEHATGNIDVVDDADNVVETLPLLIQEEAPPDQQKGMLVIGGTGGGKTVFVLGFILRALRKGWFQGGVIILDGKGSSAYAPLAGRKGIRVIARTPDEWRDALTEAIAEMQSRYDANWAAVKAGKPKPVHPTYLVVLEEAQEIRRALKKDADAYFQSLARLIRESGGMLLVSTQRPDAADAIPGAVRDQLEQRVVLGYVTPTGARMGLDDDWESAMVAYGAKPIPGRGVVRIRRGVIAPIQAFGIVLPGESPDADKFYPPRVEDSDAYEQPENVVPWKPRPPTPESGPESAEEDSGEVPPSSAGPAAAGPPAGPERARGMTRRRRTL